MKTHKVFRGYLFCESELDGFKKRYVDMVSHSVFWKNVTCKRCLARKQK